MTEIKSMLGAGIVTAQNDNRKENLRKGLMIAGGVALAGVSIFAAIRGKKISGNLQKELSTKSNEVSSIRKGIESLKVENVHKENLMPQIETIASKNAVRAIEEAQTGKKISLHISDKPFKKHFLNKEFFDTNQLQLKIGDRMEVSGPNAGLINERMLYDLNIKHLSNPVEARQNTRFLNDIGDAYYINSDIIADFHAVSGRSTCSKEDLSFVLKMGEYAEKYANEKKVLFDLNRYFPKGAPNLDVLKKRYLVYDGLPKVRGRALALRDVPKPVKESFGERYYKASDIIAYINQLGM